MDVREYIEEHAQEFLGTLSEWLRIPSISADPDRHGDVARSAEWLRDHLLGTGFPVAEIWPTGEPERARRGLPAVFARVARRGPGRSGGAGLRPSRRPAGGAAGGVGQPAVRAGAARRPAARPRRLRRQGPGAVPHPGPRRRAWPSAEASAPPVTLKLLIEGEEESGSPHFADLLRRQRERLRCDVIVISDTTMWAADVPSMCVGMRGVVAAEISLRGPERDLHSGSFGGAVPNPLHGHGGPARRPAR